MIGRIGQLTISIASSNRHTHRALARDRFSSAHRTGHPDHIAWRVYRPSYTRRPFPSTQPEQLSPGMQR